MLLGCCPGCCLRCFHWWCGFSFDMFCYCMVKAVLWFPKLLLIMHMGLLYPRTSRNHWIRGKFSQAHFRDFGLARHIWRENHALLLMKSGLSSSSMHYKVYMSLPIYRRWLFSSMVMVLGTRIQLLVWLPIYDHVSNFDLLFSPNFDVKSLLSFEQTWHINANHRTSFQN